MNTVAGGFEPYGPSHQAALLLLVLVPAILVSFARSRPSSRAADRLGKALALAILLLTLPLQAAYLTATSAPSRPPGRSPTCWARGPGTSSPRSPSCRWCGRW